MLISSMLNSAFESTSNPLFSRIYAELLNKPNNTLTDNDDQIDPQLYEVLKNYNLVQYILNYITSAMSDLIDKSGIKVSFDTNVPDYEKIQEDVNNKIESIGLFDIIKRDLPDILYYGNYGYLVNLSDFTIARISTFKELYTIDTYCKDKTFLMEGWSELSDTKFFLPIQYNSVRILDITELDSLALEDPNYTPDKREKYLHDNPNSDRIIKHSVFKGLGVLDPVMNLILLLYLKELLYDLLSIKDTMRPDILTVRVNEDRTDENDIAQSINDIEALVNDNSTSTITFTKYYSYQSFLSLIQSIESYLSNGVKVVPEINNFSSIEHLDLPDLIAKREALKTDIEDLRERILNSVGIDNDPNANKWDTITKNSRFLTLVEYMMQSIIDAVKDLIHRYCDYKYPSYKISLSQITLNLDTTNIIFNQYAVTRNSIIQDKLKNLDDILRSYSEYSENEFLDKKMVTTYFKRIITDLDPTAISLLKDDDTTIDEE